jgi:ssDNA-binding Zn-finger/Zn-ribbon topoisomerase 1
LTCGEIVLQEFGNSALCSSGHLLEKIDPLSFHDIYSVTNKLICPRCNSRLRVVSSNWNKKFIGCTAYPQCKYKRRFELKLLSRI